MCLKLKGKFQIGCDNFDRVVLFLHNKEIDHLYSLSLSQQQNVGQFAIDSIRMKSNLGLAGEAFTSSQITVDTADKYLISDEKDLGKLKLKEITSCVAIPVLDKKTGIPQAVI